MIAVSARVISPTVNVAATRDSLVVASAVTKPSAVTFTVVVSSALKVGAGNPGIGSPKASRGVAVSWTVSYPAAVDSVIAGWSSVRRMYKCVGSTIGSWAGGTASMLPHPARPPTNPTRTLVLASTARRDDQRCPRPLLEHIPVYILD